MLFFAIVYVVEGIGQARVGIIYQPLTSYLKVSGWTPVEVTAYLAVLNFPWIIKPVFGLVSDFVPLFGYRRKSYLIISSLCAVGAYGWIARLSEPGEFALLLVLTSFAMATASTLCGALLAENGQSFRLSSAFVSQQWLWFYIAIMASSFAGGALVERLPPLSALQAAAGIAAVAPIAVVLASVFLLEREEGHGEPAGDAPAPSTASCRRQGPPKLYLVALFLFLYSFAPGFGTPLYYFMTDELKFSQSYIGILGSIASAGWIAGALVHRWLLARMSSKALLYLSIVLGTLSAASFLLLSGEVTAAIVNFANGAALMIATIASLTLAADYCPKRSEGFAFAGLMSIMNLADVFSNTVGAFLYEHVFHEPAWAAHHRLRRHDGVGRWSLFLCFASRRTRLFRRDPGGLQHRAPDPACTAVQSASCCGVPPMATKPRLRRSSRISGVATAAFSASLSLATASGRRAGRRNQRVDDGAVDIAETLLLEGRDVGRRGRALGCRHAVGLELAVREILGDAGHARHAELDVAAQKVGDQRAGAAKRHMRELDLVQDGVTFGRQVHRRAHAGRAVLHVARRLACRFGDRRQVGHGASALPTNTNSCLAIKPIGTKAAGS